MNFIQQNFQSILIPIINNLGLRKTKDFGE